MMNIIRAFALASLFIACPAQAVDTFVMPGDLIYKHAKLEATCEKCHLKFDKKAQSGLCADCHKEVGKDIAEQRGYHGRLEAGKECNDCHPDHKGRWALGVTLDKEKFDHAKTDYPLKDGHADSKVQCESCHLAGKKYSEASSVCNECHKKGDKHKGMMGTDCERCHSEITWKKLAFDHNKTAYKLLGRHNEVQCFKCHMDDNYKETPKLCNTCHKKVDIHKGSLGIKCDDCHVERNWKEFTFDHDRKSTYSLLFKHRQVKCASCHINDKYKGTPLLCKSCHKKDDTHKGIFGTKCDDCHVEKGWKETQFDHDRKSTYPLLFKHKQVKCASCHKDDWIKGKLKTACISCHKKDDKHKNVFGSKCETCHVEKDWKEIVFDHDRQTRTPLLGKHKQAKCADCHKSGRFIDKMPTLCFECHAKDDMHKNTFGPMCGTCHNEKNWKEIFFDHYQETDYRLVGKHVGPKCVACHKVRIYEDERFRKDCIYCHKKDDVHKGKDGKECETCHTEMVSWKQITGKKPK
jgi:cytochrome c1